MATIEENLKIIKESTAAMKSVIETNGGDTSGDITTWANSIQTAVDNGREGIIQTSLKYYDDGTGEVVPIKHPDLSTQPSILPYKFAGNYVYEQMMWFPRPQSEINGDNYQFTIETKIGETVGANLDNGDNALLLKCDCTAVYNDGAGHQHTSIITDYKAYCFLSHCDIAFNDYSFYNETDFKGCWFRLQYCLAPKAGGYYYGGYYGAYNHDYFSVRTPFGDDKEYTIQFEHHNMEPKELEISINGEPWQKITTSEKLTVKGNSVIRFAGYNATYSDGQNNYMRLMTSGANTGNFVIEGDILSLVYGHDYLSYDELPEGTTYNFNHLFSHTNAQIGDLILRPKKLTPFCYSYMFAYNFATTTPAKMMATHMDKFCCDHMYSGCSLLSKPMDLPSINLAESCYASMFEGCGNLRIGNQFVLPATELKTRCYSSMFKDCTWTLNVAVMPYDAMLAVACCSYMYQGCTRIKEATIPQSTLAQSCYSYMFDGCTSLAKITALFLDIPDYGINPSLNYWVRDVSTNGQFIKSINANWDVIGTSGVPEGWEIIEA